MSNISVQTADWQKLDDDITKALKESINIAFLGSASCGKDSAIKSLFGIDFGEVSPIPGSTKELRAITLGKNNECIIINAPGFGDRDKNVDAIAREVLQKLDIVVYIVNAEGGVTIDEKTDFDDIKARSKDAPTLVCINKIDLIREHQRNIFVHACCSQLGIDAKEVICTSFDPLPQLYKEPIGITEVIRWLNETLTKKGKYLVLAKQLANKKEACLPIIEQATREAMVAGSIPIPGADMTAVTLVQVRMIRNIAEILQVEIKQDMVLWIIGELLGNTSKGILHWGIKALKTAGWIPGGQFITFATSALGGALSAAMTKGIGFSVVEYLSDDEKDKDLSKYKNIFEDVSKIYMQIKHPSLYIEEKKQSDDTP